MEARLAVAALKSAIGVRQPRKGCIHSSDRGSQYALETYCVLLAEQGLKGSMSRRGNPYDKAKPQSFMKTLKGRRCTGQPMKPSRMESSNLR